jgi:hypothetical protein
MQLRKVKNIIKIVTNEVQIYRLINSSVSQTFLLADPFLASKKNPRILTSLLTNIQGVRMISIQN